MHHQKKAKKTTKGKSTHGSSHPKYSEMIKAALKSLNDRGGSSRAAILKFVLANYSLDPIQANQHLKLALKNGVKGKYFKQTKGNGASGSFKLASTGETKPTKTKKSSSSTSKASSGTKKRARSKSAGSKPAKKVATTANTNNSAATTPAATTTPAVTPKKVHTSKSRSSAAPKSANAITAKKPTQAKAKKQVQLNQLVLKKHHQQKK